MTAPTPADYLNLSQAIYTTGGMPTPPAGWSILDGSNGQPLFESNTATGMQAVAFTNGSIVVIAYEGTYPPNLVANVPMAVAQAAADAAIAQDQVPGADPAALAFATSVASAAGSMPIYVTGHSLGGEEAAYVQSQADKPGSTIAIAGGASFGAPGVPLLTVADTNQNFTSYVDDGDVVPHAPQGVATVGNVQPEGNSDDAALEAALNAAGLFAVAAGIAYYSHSLTKYANDLGVTLGSPDQFNDGSPDLSTSLWNGSPITIGSNTGSTVSYSLADGQAGELVTGNTSINVPTSGSLAVVDAINGSMVTGESVTGSSNGFTIPAARK